MNSASIGFPGPCDPRHTSARWRSRGRCATEEYGILAIVLLIRPAETDAFLDRWIVAIGLAIVAITGLLYLFLARPDRHSDDVPEGDALKVAQRLQQIRLSTSTASKPAVPSEEIR